MPGLPDRGYSASKALGLLVWGYAFWLLSTFGILRNNSGGLLFALLLLAAACIWAWRGLDSAEFLSWWRARQGLVITVEILFVICFAGWAFVRAANPEAVGTEKPMELAFINAILSSPVFPPHDPWLSGYSISYYYFGYVIVAMIAKACGTSGGVAFNLGVALVFALSGTGAYGILYNLLASSKPVRDSTESDRPFSTVLTALLGPLFILFVSNLEGFLHVLHTRGVFWQRDGEGRLVSAFWRWLDIKDLNAPPSEPLAWVPDKFWWWWRASRVLQDYDLAGSPKEIIDEFPFFSYLLADLHPHVLAMPFALLAISLALNALLTAGHSPLRQIHLAINHRSVAWAALTTIPVGVILLGMGARALNFFQAGAGVGLLILAGFAMLRLWDTLLEHGFQVLGRGDLGTYELRIGLHLGPIQFLLAAVVLGGMAFMNTWDFPLYVVLFSAAHALGLSAAFKRRVFSSLKEFFWLSLALVIAGGILYLPFYWGFSSQAGGILPNLIYVTRGAHLWTMFAPLMAPIGAFLLLLLFPLSPDRKSALTRGFLWAGSLVFGLWALALLVGLAILLTDQIIPNAGQLFQATLASPGARALFQAAFMRRLTSPGAWMTLLAVLGLALAFFHRLDGSLKEVSEGETDDLPVEQDGQRAFGVLLVLFGALLILFPEFFFLQDQFGWRMNTIFKFYFQAWLIWGLAAAYSSAELFKDTGGAVRLLWRTGWALLIGASLVYPALSLLDKTNSFQPERYTLDSTAYFAQQAPDEMAAIGWLKTAPPGIVAEAVPASGGSYTGYARAATLSGKPAVLGWFGHESQWRGGGELLGPRKDDLTRLYCSRDWEATRSILDQYQIRYVFVGNLERDTYRAGAENCPVGLVDTKFIRYLTPIFQQGQVIIYEYNPTKVE